MASLLNYLDAIISLNRQVGNLSQYIRLLEPILSTTPKNRKWRQEKRGKGEKELPPLSLLKLTARPARRRAGLRLYLKHVRSSSLLRQLADQCERPASRGSQGAIYQISY